MTYVLRVLLAIDELINALTGGYADETISYRAAIEAQLGTPWGCYFCKLMELFHPGHCDLQQPSKADRLSRGWVSDQRWYENHHVKAPGMLSHD